LGNEDDEKLIGVYSSEGEAKEAITRLAKAPGFRECPEGFSIDSYELGKDHWTDGYATV
jgi:homoserine kinase type II